MKIIALIIFDVCISIFSGCTVISYNRAFPKLTWAWTAEAKEQRVEQRQQATADKAYQDSLKTNSIIVPK